MSYNAQYMPAETGGNWQTEEYTVQDDGAGNPVLTFTLPSAVFPDANGDPLIRLEYFSTVPRYAVDYTVADVTLTWISVVALEIGEVLTVWYAPA